MMLFLFDGHVLKQAACWCGDDLLCHVAVKAASRAVGLNLSGSICCGNTKQQQQQQQQKCFIAHGRTAITGLVLSGV